ncbi:MAG: ATP-binding protein [Burkholderiaceae bacterium]
MPHRADSRRRGKSFIGFGLFSRSFVLLSGLMLLSLGAWVQVFFNLEEEPRALQMAQRVTSTVGITQSALIYAPEAQRPDLVLDLATKESLRVQPRDRGDVLVPPPDTSYWRMVITEIKARLGPGTQVMWRVNDMPGIWVSFTLGNEQFWLVFDREQLGLATGVEWLGWGASALLLAFIGAGVSASFVNRPIARIAEVAKTLARGEFPAPLPETGPTEIREMNIAFNRMARDIRQTETDREIMLAGISHDLRTPLARMRLEIEMCNVPEEIRQAIDEDLAQIDHSIGQLMEYARPVSAVPEHGENVSEALLNLYERERMHTESLGGRLAATIEPDLYARISGHDVKRIVSNLIENSRRYGRSTDDGIARIELVAFQEKDKVVIEVKDRGAGVEQSDVERLLRPFSRGESARTGVSGAGLGLAIVERLLAQVEGTFQLLPRPSGGLVARIEIPSVRPSNGSSATA